MSSHDVCVDRVDPLVAGVDVIAPHAGDTPLSHAVVDVDVADAVDLGTMVDEVFASVYGDLPIVTAHGLTDTRWRLEVPAVMLGRDFRLTVHAQTPRGVVGLVQIRGRNGRYGTRPDGIQALLMHQLGRAGSTMMMRLLAGHPGISVFDDYPLETRPGLAAMHTLAVLGGPVLPGEEAFFDEVETATANPYVTEYFVGSKIVHDYHRTSTGRLRAALAESIEEVYATHQPGARFFAEKFRIESQAAERTQATTLATWPGSRQIILVRDPRDLLCSRLSFNRQRSWASFDLDLNDDAVTGAPTIVDHIRRAARQRRAFPDAIMVRYEDLVLQPTATATSILRDLGLDHGYATVRRCVSHALDGRSDQHVTTSSAAASVGRWRDELPARAAQHLANELADELVLFGYDT